MTKHMSAAELMADEPATLTCSTSTAPSADDAVEIIEPDPHLFSDITTATHHEEDAP